MKTNLQQIRLFLTATIHELEYLRERVKNSLDQAPDGSLVLSKSNGSTQYFLKTSSTQKRGTYIEKKNQTLIRELAQKDYDQRILKEIEQQLLHFRSMLKHIPRRGLPDIFDHLPPQRKALVNPYFLSNEEYKKQWLEVTYKGKSFSDESPCYITENGEMVRSKVEKIIADKLFMMKLPYRYEYPLKLKDLGIVYPDFTILKITTREEIYWEHLGMMDNPSYCQKAIQKLHTYGRNGIYPGKNLIVTFETIQTPLDMRWVEKMLVDVLEL